MAAKEYSPDNMIAAPCRYAAAVTPHDTNEMGYVSRGIYVGTAGDLTVIMVDDTTGGTPVTFPSVPGGAFLPIRIRRVNATGTTASGVVAVW